MLYEMECELNGDMFTLSGSFTFDITVTEDDHSHPDQAYARIVKSYSAEIQTIKCGDKVIDREMMIDLFGSSVASAEDAAANEYEKENS